MWRIHDDDRVLTFRLSHGIGMCMKKKIVNLISVKRETLIIILITLLIAITNQTRHDNVKI